MLLLHEGDNNNGGRMWGSQEVGIMVTSASNCSLKKPNYTAGIITFNNSSLNNNMRGLNSGIRRYWRWMDGWNNVILACFWPTGIRKKNGSIDLRFQVLNPQRLEKKEGSALTRRVFSSSTWQEVETTATSWVISSSCSAWFAGWCTAAFPVSWTPAAPLSLLHTCRHAGFPLFSLRRSLTSSSSSLRLEDPLRHQLRQGRLLALPDPDRLLLPLDVLDVPQQRLPLHVGGGAHHVSALPGPTRLNWHRRPRCSPSLPALACFTDVCFFILSRSQLWASPPTRGWTLGDTSTLKSRPRPSKAPSSKKKKTTSFFMLNTHAFAKCT